jgi:hypothetical protein
MEFLNRLVVILLLASVFVACSKTQHNPVPSGGPGIYVSGTQRQTGGINEAVYWKNGLLVELSKNLESSATNIVVSGNDVYVAGKIGSWVGYWKNGVFDSLADDENATVQIVVFGNDVYVTSYSQSGQYHYSGVYKNGIYTEVVPGDTRLGLTSIAVGNQGVLLGGFEANPDGLTPYTATYRLNNIEHILTDGAKTAMVTGVAFAQTDIYAAGMEANSPILGKRSIAKYWKNDIANILSDLLGSSITSGIFVSGQDVYVSGSSFFHGDPSGNQIAKYWKNNTEYVLTDSLSDCEATAITVTGPDVYVVVQDLIPASRPWEVAKYFKNGKEVDLTDGSFFATAYGIYVQPN